MMTEQELETLLSLLRKFHLITGFKILDVESAIFEFVRKTPVFKAREGVYMDEKMAYEHDMQVGDDKLEKYEERNKDDF